MTMSIYDKDFRKQYELARRIGDMRFGSPCTHEQVVNGTCKKCLRKVIAKPNSTGVRKS